ncbi:hypothetical protein [Nostoc favosum]|uniref:Uncharacterized protein n=1 Tax=Nostoc favosum CHAB5714 TaxID=2780399 RepID=A0ABS8IBY9_9NOSO|nr:hypothetical protein [Nostoc favosum]MCC5601748.1 hypothetical protein [Nostoc favosum CHAB5714]
MGIQMLDLGMSIVNGDISATLFEELNETQQSSIVGGSTVNDLEATFGATQSLAGAAGQTLTAIEREAVTGQGQIGQKSGGVLGATGNTVFNALGG